MNNLRKLRIKLGLTLKDVEEKTGINRDYLSLMETEKRPINQKNMKVLCEFYKVKPNELLGYDKMLVINENANDFNEKDINMLRAIKSLSDEDYDMLNEYINFLIWRHKKRIEEYYDKERHSN